MTSETQQDDSARSEYADYIKRIEKWKRLRAQRDLEVLVQKADAVDRPASAAHAPRSAFSKTCSCTNFKPDGSALLR
jgi:hypothetical protein